MRLRWFKRKNNLINESGFVLPSANCYADSLKLQKVYQDVEKGLKNYTLFQRFHYYRWPLWLCPSLDADNKAFRPVTPPCLINDFHREWISFTNFLSPNHVLVDPSGMISPEHCSWSIELWVMHNRELYRPQHDLQSIIQKRDSQTGLISTEWKRKEFTLLTELYGTRTSIDEAIVDLTCTINTKPSGSSLLLVFRPYNNDIIGGINTIEFREAEKSVRINKKESVHINKNPREVFSENGSCGDLMFSESSKKSDSPTGMSTMALLYPVKKDGLNIKIRLSLNDGKALDSLKLNYQNIKKDFLDYTGLMRTKGFTTSLKDTFFADWLSIAKLTALGQVNRLSSFLRSTSIENQTCREAFFLVKSLSRMGYCEEAGFIVETWLKALRPIEPDLPFRDAINHCYLLSSFTDYYIITRDGELLKKYFENMRSLAASLVKPGRKLVTKSETESIGNSIQNIHSREIHIQDIMLFSHSMTQYAYLARTIGLFGEEIKYSGEAKLLNDYLKDAVTCFISYPSSDIVEPGAIANPSVPLDDFFGQLSFSLFPYGNESFNNDDHIALFKTITEFYKKFPVFIKSIGGLDVFLSFMLANNLLFLKDNRSLDIADFLLGIGSGKYSLPDYLHPITLNGIHGEGESGIVNSTILLLLRNMIFIDSPNRLELFPCPRQEWFAPGSEFSVEYAPSRFGMIFFKVICTMNEIQLFFNELPKFIPPDIMIHLPFDTTIKEGDDFVLKKESGTTYVINGWPSVVRFGRK